MQNDSVITCEQVMNRLKDVKLDDYTRDDLLERYVIYGSETEINEPSIQRTLINNDLYMELLNMVDIITDAGAIQDLIQSNLFKNRNICAMEGKISSIQFSCKGDSNIKPDDIIFRTIVYFEDMNGNKHRMYGHTFNNLKDVQAHRIALRSYYDNIVLILEKHNEELNVVGFLKKYEDINYKKQIRK